MDAPDRSHDSNGPGVLPGVPRPERPPVRWIAYVDLDAFYVSCELRERPELAGTPVIVGPPPSEGPSRGVVLSASYEARKFGVHSAQPAVVAARLCPQASWIPPDFAKYERASHEVRSVLARHSDEVIPYSIDEAAVVLSVGSAEGARAVAASIQAELKEELRLPSSIGVATSRLLAKVATDRAKPGGICVVAPNEVAAFVAGLPTRAIPGIGPKTEEVLRTRGIEKVGDFAKVRAGDARRWLGDFGRELVALARGEPIEESEHVGGPRSRSTDRTFAVDVDRWEEIEAAVREMADDLARALEKEGLRYGSVGVAFRWADFTRTQRVRALPASREGSAPLAERALRLARELWEAERLGRRRPVRTLSVRAERLVERTQRQAHLDDFPGAAERPPAVK
jgi:DNA polymerase IV